MSALSIPPRTRITAERYETMIASGALTKHDRVQLIEGEILEMAPIGPRHAMLVNRLTKWLVLGVKEAGMVSTGHMLRLGEASALEPDVLVLKPRDDDYGTAHPRAADVLLLIEVSDSSLAFDQSTKLDLYARHGITEYWVVDAGGRRIVMYREPAEGRYAQQSEASAADAASSRAFPDVRIEVGRLFA